MENQLFHPGMRLKGSEDQTIQYNLNVPNVAFGNTHDGVKKRETK